MRFCTVSEVQQHLNLIDGVDSNSYLEILIEAASESVCNYVQGNIRNEHGEIYAVLKSATLLLVGDMYENREGNTQEEQIDPRHGYGYLPIMVTRLLIPLRRPVVV